MDVGMLDDWAFVVLPKLNESIISGRTDLKELIDATNHILAAFPATDEMSPNQACQLIVHLGIWGSSIARHYHEAHPSVVQTNPGFALSLLYVSSSRTPFRAYFHDLILKSGFGHPERDAYASLVRWNTPPMQAHWKGQSIAGLPSVFADGRIRTYTSNIGETLILELFKRCETLEKAANDLLVPLRNDYRILTSREAVERLQIASCMLAGVRRFLIDFFTGDHRGRLSEQHFLDVFRQFAVHWDLGDVPPSGPQDVEFLKRDILLGINFPNYNDSVRRIYPGLLAEERDELDKEMHYPPLPHLMLDAVGLTVSDINHMSTNDLAQTIERFPILAALYYLLRANARVSSSHLGLAKNYLFKPADRRLAAGQSDHAVVPNHYGITGISETILDRLTAARKAHPLHRFGEFADHQIYALSRIKPDPLVSTAQAHGLLNLELPISTKRLPQRTFTTTPQGIPIDQGLTGLAGAMTETG